ncbi:MAG TPA: dihydrofolate reductase family protein [Anaerolineales bacterium]|nr:dihydrofolate reductase family protein [Anaerolineales bacterium]
MRKLIFQINVSLDGFADHTVAIADDELHDFSTERLDDLDTILFGRVTYQLFESHWPSAAKDPHATKSVIEFADKINAVPKVVFSSTLHDVKWNNTRLVKEGMAEEVLKLKQGTGKNLSVGGLRIAATLAKLSLIDEYWILVHPVIVGAGRRLFENTKERLNLKLAGTRTFHSGAVALHYLTERNP